MKGPLDSRQLQAFVILAGNGSFTQTAREMFLTQSAVSHSMKALESDVGCRLFDRMGKKVSLTLAGEHLLHHAQRVMREMQNARDGLEQLGKWGRGRLRVAAPDTLCAYLLPKVLREFKVHHPQTLISIEPGDATDVIPLLEQGRADLALTLEIKPDERFDFTPLFEDELAFITSPQHPWAAQKTAVKAEIAAQSLIIYGRKSQTWRLVDEHFRKEGLVPNTLIELSSVEAIKELVKLNLGISILAPWAVQKESKDGSLAVLPLGRRKLKRTWGVLHWRARRLGLGEEKFLSICRTIADGMPRML